MEQLTIIVLLILVALGARVLQWWLQKQRADAEAAERRTRRTRGRTAAPPVPTGRSPRPPVRRPAKPTVQRGAPPPDTRPAIVEKGRPSLGALEGRRLGKLKGRRLTTVGTGTLSSIEVRIEPRIGTETPAARPAAPAKGYLGDLLEGSGAARAIVLAEILGTPVGLRDL